MDVSNSTPHSKDKKIQIWWPHDVLLVRDSILLLIGTRKKGESSLEFRCLPIFCLFKWRFYFLILRQVFLLIQFHPEGMFPAINSTIIAASNTDFSSIVSYIYQQTYYVVFSFRICTIFKHSCCEIAFIFQKLFLHHCWQLIFILVSIGLLQGDINVTFFIVL